MKTSDLMARCLENEKAEYIFGLPGEENLELLDSLSDSTIKFITTRHEQGAAFMADVYGRIKHKPGICLATLGPGALNLATGVANANLDHSPLVAITGQTDFKTIHKEQHQYVDIVDAYKSLTKWNARISSKEIIPEIVRKAFRIAVAEKQGATHIELPNDIAREQTEGKPLQILEIKLPHAPSEEIEKAAGLINNSSYPIILVGNGIVRMQKTDALLGFIEKTSIPVAKTFMSKGTVSGSHPLSLGTVGARGDYILEEFGKSDLVITIGYDLVEYSPKFWNNDSKKKIVCIDSVPVEFIDSYYAVSVELIGDFGHNLYELAKKIKKREYTEPRELKERIIKERTSYDIKYPLKPQHILNSLRNAMKEDDILISDVGEHKKLISRLFRAYKPNTVIVSNGLASMGIALPGSIGAKVAAPEKSVVAVCGDGGFLMNVQELETAKRLNLDITILVWRDDGYGMIELDQIRDNKKVFGVKFNNPDFVKLAESFGARGYRVERASELEDILKTAISGDGISVVDIPVKYD